MAIDVPDVTPVTSPVAEPIVAFALLIDHLPPVVPSLKVVVEPTHTEVVPVMADGKALMIIVVVDLQPDANE